MLISNLRYLRFSNSFLRWKRVKADQILLCPYRLIPFHNKNLSLNKRHFLPWNPLSNSPLQPMYIIYLLKRIYLLALSLRDKETQIFQTFFSFIIYIISRGSPPPSFQVNKIIIIIWRNRYKFCRLAFVGLKSTTFKYLPTLICLFFCFSSENLSSEVCLGFQLLNKLSLMCRDLSCTRFDGCWALPK